jgi:hypothetical protein
MASLALVILLDLEIISIYLSVMQPLSDTRASSIAYLSKLGLPCNIVARGMKITSQG